MPSLDDIKQRYAPVDDPAEQALRIANWSLFFLGDEANPNHYWVRTDVPKIHLNIYEALSNEYQHYYVTAPRGFAKSTCVQVVYVLYRIVYGLEPYILLIEKNSKAGKRTLANLKYELGKNPKLIQVYGELRPTKNRIHKDFVDSAEEMRLLNNTFVRCIGIDGDARGGLDRMHRYTMILGNDMQDARTMREPATMEGNIAAWERDVEPAIDEKYGKIRAVGNMLGTGCLMESIKNDSKYTGVDFSALVDNNGNPDLKGHSVWEEMFSTKKLQREAEIARRKGKLHIFMAERMNIIDDAGSKKLEGYRYHNMQFQRKYDQNILTGDDFGGQSIPVNTYYVIDPAYSRTDTADARVGCVVACGKYPHRDYSGKMVMVNGLWIFDYSYSRGDPTELINIGLELHHTYYFTGLIVEANGPQQIYEYLGDKALMQDEFSFKHPLQFIPVKHVSGKKEDRIYEAMSTMCKLGQFFIRMEHVELRDELELFLRNPSGLHIIDAVAMGKPYYSPSNEELRNSGYPRRKYIESKQQQEAFDLNNPLSIFSNMRDVYAD